MSRTYQTVAAESTDEIVEKKSRFIAYVAPVSTKEDAYGFVERVKKRHYDAKHHCFAFSVEEDTPFLKYSDDGEPQGTAGKPILEVICGAGLSNLCIVVVRYFGGTLLGTGGLVRAYTEAARRGLSNNTVIQKTLMAECNLTCDYTDFGKLTYIMTSMGVVVRETNYEDKVHVNIYIPEDMTGIFEKKVKNETAGRGSLIMKGDFVWV